MELVPVLMGLPAVFAVLSALVRDDRIRGWIVYIGAVFIMAAAFFTAADWAQAGGGVQPLYEETEGLNHLMQAAEGLTACFLLYLGVKYRRWEAAILSVGQTALLFFAESAATPEPAPHLLLDSLSVLMLLLVALVGGLICIYAVGYMRGYHAHHREYGDRRPFFFAMLFLFLSAMFGLVLSQNLIWMYFFWECTSVISFLLIGYTRTEEAVNNSFRALWMNLLGGFGFAVSIAFLLFHGGNVQLDRVTELGAALPLACLAFAGLTKSAQLPFSSWLLGAMAAPTPSSALLHSATMVKAGVYLLIRLSPALHGSLPGFMTAAVGGFTFVCASLMAVSQSDGKRVLAFSTISNLGLIVACAGVGAKETVWAAVLLLLFHAVSKSMLFQAVGAVENSLGTREIEDMGGLLVRLPRLACIMGIGIAGMYLAPFGMLIAKWAALKAFVDSGNILLVLCVAYGSAATLFYWTKWLVKLMEVPFGETPSADATGRDEYLSMGLHGLGVLALCFFFSAVAAGTAEPAVRELFGTAEPALAGGLLAVTAILAVSVLAVLALMYRISGQVEQRKVLSYMGGVNAGDDRTFLDSKGAPKKLYPSGWYLETAWGSGRLLKPCASAAAVFLSAMFCLMLGGVG